jgi:hypothetical protein
MVIRITSVVLSLSGVLALIIGLLLWTHTAPNLVSLHMLLGLLVVAALWVIGIAQAFARGGSWMLATGALILGALVLYLGMIQSSLMIGEFHWIIQVVHLLLGLAAIGVGHMAAARYRKGAAGQ